MKYIVEWQAGGEIHIDTAGTDWSPEELETNVGNALDDIGERAFDNVVDEFDDCEVSGDTGEVEFKLRRIS